MGEFDHFDTTYYRNFLAARRCDVSARTSLKIENPPRKKLQTGVGKSGIATAQHGEI